jgi:hypothetical protein
MVPSHSRSQLSFSKNCTTPVIGTKCTSTVDLLYVGRLSQTNHYEGVLAGRVVDAVVGHLVVMKQLPTSFLATAALDMGPVMLSRPSRLPVVGRKQEVQRVVEALTGDAGAAVLVAGPGEGKTTVAMEAGLDLCKRGWFPGGPFVIDFLGRCMYGH